MLNPKHKVLAYLARHGETTFNEDDRIQGPNNDAPLTEKGKKQATALRGFFKDKAIGAVYHSNITSSRDSAHAMNYGMAYGNSDLQPLHRGSFSGMPKTKAVEKKMKEVLANRDQRFPGGESLNEFHGRVLPAVKDLADQGRTMHPPVAIVHGSVMHAVGESYNGDHKSALVEHGGVAAIVEDERGNRYAKAIHLPNMESDKTS